jgi:hypothetical protein
MQQIIIIIINYFLLLSSSSVVLCKFINVFTFHSIQVARHLLEALHHPMESHLHVDFEPVNGTKKLSNIEKEVMDILFWVMVPGASHLLPCAVQPFDVDAGLMQLLDV